MIYWYLVNLDKLNHPIILVFMFLVFCFCKLDNTKPQPPFVKRRSCPRLSPTNAPTIYDLIRTPIFVNILRLSVHPKGLSVLFLAQVSAKAQDLSQASSILMQEENY